MTDDIARTKITIGAARLAKGSARNLLRAARDLANGQTQFILQTRRLEGGAVMQVDRLRCFTPESALETIEILKRWPRR